MIYIRRKAVSYILTLAMMLSLSSGFSFIPAAYAEGATIYLSNTAAGASDSNDGLSATSPAATFSKAKEKLGEDGKIQVVGSIGGAMTIPGTDSWDLSNVTGSSLIITLKPGTLNTGIILNNAASNLTLSNINIVNTGTATSASIKTYLINLSKSGGNPVLNLTLGTSISAGVAYTGVAVGNGGLLNIGSGVAITGGTGGNIALMHTAGKICINGNLTNQITLALYVASLRAEGTVIGTVSNGVTDISKLVYQPAASEQWYFKLDGNNIVVTATNPVSAKYNITASATTTGGAISPAGVTAVVEGHSQSYTVTPAEGYHISDVKVDDASVLSDGAYSVTNGVGSYTFSNVTTSHAITAEFAKNPLTVSAKKVDFYAGKDCRTSTMPHGQTVTITNNSTSAITLSSLPQNTTYFAIGLSSTIIPAGGTVTMTATPSAAQFIGANGRLLPNCTNNITANGENIFADAVTIRTSDDSLSIPMTISFHVKSAKTVTLVGPEHGVFKIPSADYLDRQGRISTGPAYRVVRDGEEVTILAHSDGNNVGQGADINIIADEGYKRETGKNGSAKMTVYSDAAPQGVEVEGTNIPMFGADSDKDTNGDGIIEGDFSSNMRYVVTFVKSTFNITSSAIVSRGSITAGGSVEYGTDREFTITPNLGYHIDKVYVDGPSTSAAIDAATGVGKYTFSNVTQAHTIEARFAENHYTLAFDKNSSDATGTMADQTGFIYGISKDVSPCAFILKDSRFLGWSKSKDSGVASYPDGASLNIATALDNETVKLYAVWGNDYSNITSTKSTAGGDITAGGKVKYGTDAEFTITPDMGYHIYKIRVDTVPVVIDIDPGSGIGKYKFTNVTQDHAIDAEFAANSYSIGFDKNASDATGTMSSQTGLKYGTLAALPQCAFARNGYVFAGWTTSSTGAAVSFSDQGSANIATKHDGETVTLYALWSVKSNPDNPGGGSGGGGGGAGEVPKKSDEGLVKDSGGAQKAVAVTDTSAKTDISGRATANVDKNALGSALAQAVKTAEEADKKAGSAAGTTGVEVIVEVSADAGAKSVETSLPPDTLKEIAQQNNAQLTVSTPLAEITLDRTALEAITDQAGGKVSLHTEKVDSASLPEAAQAAVGDAPVYDLKVLGESGTVSDFKGGTATVSIPYTLKAGESASQVTVYYINDAGELTKMNCVYNPDKKMATFTTNHFSYYTVMAASGAGRFIDVNAAAWYYGATEYVVTKGLFNGTGETTFSPNAAMTRAMFITALGRASGVNAADYTKSGFSDVAGGSWYGSYAEWACESKIISGIGGGKFAPEQAITREQMASILNNYYKWKNAAAGAAATQLSYTDAGRISSWAEEGVRLCTANKWLTGYPDGSFMPQKTATRAEVAAILQRYAQTN